MKKKHKHNKKRRESDIIKDNYIKQHFNCHIIHINWDTIENEINDVVKIINRIKNNTK
jgi:hypothetical protein